MWHKQETTQLTVTEAYNRIGEIIKALAATNVEPSELLLTEHGLRHEIRQGIIQHVVSIRMSGETLASVGHFNRDRANAAHVLAATPAGVIGKGQGENNLRPFRDGVASGKAILTKS